MKFLIDLFREITGFFNKKFKNSTFIHGWETMSTFFFSPKSVNPLDGSHLCDNIDLKRYVSIVMAASAPTIEA